MALVMEAVFQEQKIRRRDKKKRGNKIQRREKEWTSGKKDRNKKIKARGLSMSDRKG